MVKIFQILALLASAGACLGNDIADDITNAPKDGILKCVSSVHSFNIINGKKSEEIESRITSYYSIPDGKCVYIFNPQAIAGHVDGKPDVIRTKSVTMFDGGQWTELEYEQFYDGKRVIKMTRKIDDKPPFLIRHNGLFYSGIAFFAKYFPIREAPDGNATTIGESLKGGKRSAACEVAEGSEKILIKSKRDDFESMAEISADGIIPRLEYVEKIYSANGQTITRSYFFDKETTIAVRGSNALIPKKFVRTISFSEADEKYVTQVTVKSAEIIKDKNIEDFFVQANPKDWINFAPDNDISFGEDHEKIISGKMPMPSFPVEDWCEK